MRLQLLSDLHLETETFDPEPAPGAELLVLAGDIDSRWDSLARFAGWPQPMLFVAGNHEFDGRDLDLALPALRRRCTALGITLLERESITVADAAGRPIRFVGTTRWSDFDCFGESGRAKAMRAGEYFLTLMKASRGGRPFDAAAVRAEALACRAWLEAELARPTAAERTVVITHFAPSLRSADPRYGLRSGTASFCNADDDLLCRADLWLHGHLHCTHDYAVAHAGGGSTRVVCNARGHAGRGEAAAHQPKLVIDI